MSDPQLYLREPLEPLSVLGVYELASLLGIRVATVSMWRRRDILPPADEELHAGAVWFWRTIKRWLPMANTRADQLRDRFPLFLHALTTWATLARTHQIGWRLTRDHGPELYDPATLAHRVPEVRAAWEALHDPQAPMGWSPGFWWRWLEGLEASIVHACVARHAWDNPDGQLPLPAWAGTAAPALRVPPPRLPQLPPLPPEDPYQ